MFGATSAALSHLVCLGHASLVVKYDMNLDNNVTFHQKVCIFTKLAVAAKLSMGALFIMNTPSTMAH